VNADKKRIYVVKANGSVQVGRGGSKWFRRETRSSIEPGDTIVVPLDVDRMPSLALWQTSTTIIYNLAIAAAAIGSL
jgi:polysaccharide export outer membrane protein